MNFKMFVLCRGIVRQRYLVHLVGIELLEPLGSFAFRSLGKKQVLTPKYFLCIPYYSAEFPNSHVSYSSSSFLFYFVAVSHTHFNKAQNTSWTHFALRTRSDPPQKKKSGINQALSKIICYLHSSHLPFQHKNNYTVLESCL